jgi:hypothetical protein
LDHRIPRVRRIAKALGAAKALASLNPERIKQAIFDAAASARFRRGIREISRGRAIVIDRLHVHICSLLLGRPHAVLDNTYGKVRRFMAAFSGGTDLSYVAASIHDGIAWRAVEPAGETTNEAARTADWHLPSSSSMTLVALLFPSASRTMLAIGAV